MDATVIKTQLKTKQFDKFYIFAGDDWYIQRIYLEQIALMSEKELKYIDSISDVYQKLKSKSFLQKHYVYVLRDDKDLMQNESLQQKIETELVSDILVLILSTVDMRLKFCKTFKNKIIEFNHLTADVLQKYIQKVIKLSNKNCMKLMEVCEYDYGRCMSEIDKIKRFDYDNPNDAFEKLLKSNVIYQPPKDAIFDFVDAVLDRNVADVFNLFEQCKAVGEATMVMLTVLYNNAKAVLQVQNCTGDVASVTGLNNWQIMNAKKHLHKYRNGELKNIMQLCQECQQNIVTGLIDDEFVMDYILVNVL